MPDKAKRKKSKRRASSTTGRVHNCPLPAGEMCYWSGDLYASHGVGF